jgi:hypothetical protein
VKKRILVIDFWMKALHHITPIYQRLDKSRYEVVLVHFAHIVGHKNEEKERVIDGIRCYDYRNFSKWSLSRILRKINPSAIIILNFWDLLDRAIIKLGKRKNIPVFYLQHGVFALHIGYREMKNLVKGRYSPLKYVKKLKQYMYYFTFYLTASFSLDKFYFFKRELYLMIFQAFTNPVSFVYYTPKNQTAYPALSFVYGEKDKETLINIGYSEESIKVVGSVLFEKSVEFLNKPLKLEEEKKWLVEKNLCEKQETVLYLPSSLVEWGALGWTRDKFQELLIKIYDIVTRNKSNLVIKLHPHADESLYECLRERKNIWIIKNYDLIEITWRSQLVLADWTSAIIPAIIFKKPIIFPRFVEGISYGFDYSQYNMGIVCKNEQDFEKLLRAHDELGSIVNFKSYDIYLKDFCKFGGIETSRLIAQHIEKHINESAAN